ncbi:transposase [Sulfurospirillum sp. 1307]
MPRRYRITSPGYYHIINRGVERRKIFFDVEDFESFLDILLFVSKRYKITVHSYCLMNNHYHLLLETTETNISQAIRYLNANYASYFNKKYKRNGHLWQSRFFSNYLFDEEHFWIVTKYIERNPIKANIIKKIEDYKYQSLFQYIHKQKYFSLIEKSKILSMKIKDYYSYLNTDISEEYINKVYTEPKYVIKESGGVEILDIRIEKFFENDRDINRLKNIKKAYEYGYTKAEIANFLNISRTMISKYLK